MKIKLTKQVWWWPNPPWGDGRSKESYPSRSYYRYQSTRFHPSFPVCCGNSVGYFSLRVILQRSTMNRKKFGRRRCRGGLGENRRGGGTERRRSSRRRGCRTSWRCEYLFEGRETHQYFSFALKRVRMDTHLLSWARSRIQQYTRSVLHQGKSISVSIVLHLHSKLSLRRQSILLLPELLRREDDA